MKIKYLLEKIEQYKKEHPDLLEWDIYTEQPYLCVPPNYKNIDDYINELKEEDILNNDHLNEPYINELIKSQKIMKKLQLDGWKFQIDNDGWVYRDTAEPGFMTIFSKEKIISINNNF